MDLLEQTGRTSWRCARAWTGLQRDTAPLDARTHRTIYSAACRELRRCRDVQAASDPVLRMTLKAVRDLAKLGWYQHRWADLVVHEQRRLTEFFQPGAGNTRATTARLGVGAAALPGLAGLGAGTTLSVSRARQEFSVETGEVGGGTVLTVGAELDAIAGLAHGPALGATVRIERNCARFSFAASPNAWAMLKARRTAAKLRLPHRKGPVAHLLRVIGNPLHTRRDHYADAQTRAVCWEQRLPVLLGQASGHGPAPSRGAVRPVVLDDAPPLLQDVQATTTTVAGRLTAGTISAIAQAAISRSRMHVGVDLPFDPLTTPLADEELRLLVDGSDRRMRPLLSAAAVASPRAHGALACLVQLARRPVEGTLMQRLHACQLIATEFRHALQLAALAECGAAAPDRKRARQVLRRQLQQWHCSDLHRLAERMLDGVHWLTLPARQQADPSTAIQDLDEAATAASALLRGYPVPRPRGRARHGAAAYRHLVQDTHSISATISADLSHALLGAGLSATVTRGKRGDFSPLRAGRSVDITLKVAATIDAMPFAALLREAVPDTDASTANGIVSAINQQLTLSALQAQGALQVQLHFFRPDYQKAGDFPAAARGMHLQHVRVQHEDSLSIGGQTAIPVTPGLGLSGGVHWDRRRERPACADLFFPGTISGLLLRYKSACEQTGDPDQAWQRLNALHAGCLKRYLDALQITDSPASLETRYWLSHAPGVGDDTTVIPLSRPGNVAQLRPLLDALLVAVRAEQARSDRISKPCFPAQGSRGRREEVAVAARLAVTRL